MDASDLKRIKELEAENARLKRMYADLALENTALAQYMVTEHELPIAKSCRCVGLSRSAYYCVPDHWTISDAEVIAALARLVEGRPSRTPALILPICDLLLPIPTVCSTSTIESGY